MHDSVKKYSPHLSKFTVSFFAAKCYPKYNQETKRSSVMTHSARYYAYRYFSFTYFGKAYVGLA